MDGYVITEHAEEALAAFSDESVRHVAVLDSGEGFVAFEGPAQPAPGSVLLSRDMESWLPTLDKVRKSGPQVGDVEAFALISAAQFGELIVRDTPLVGVTVLTSGNVLIQTRTAIPGAIWSATATSWLDKRLMGAAVERKSNPTQR